MVSNAFLSEEECRLEELRSFDILDTLPDPSFDRITLLAKTVFQTPIALISLVDTDRQWFKSNQGLEAPETPRAHAFCHYTIQQNEPLIIEDATLDPRTKDNPLVTGDPFIRFYAGAPLMTRNGYKLGSLCIIDRKPQTIDMDKTTVLQTLAAMVVDEMELRKLAGNDSLTGALTRRAFDEAAALALLRTQRHLTACTALMIDLDHLKGINDQFGHAAGDALLMKTVQICRENLRKTDPIGRRGGDEFCILLEDTNAEGACIVAERIRKALASMSLDIDGKTIHLTASFGLAQWRSSDKTVENLLARADEALYCAKENGRNAIYCHNGKEIVPVPDLLPQWPGEQ